MGPIDSSIVSLVAFHRVSSRDCFVCHRMRPTVGQGRQHAVWAGVRGWLVRRQCHFVTLPSVCGNYGEFGEIAARLMPAGRDETAPVPSPGIHPLPVQACDSGQHCLALNPDDNSRGALSRSLRRTDECPYSSQRTTMHPQERQTCVEKREIQAQNPACYARGHGTGAGLHHLFRGLVLLNGLQERLDLMMA